MIRINKILCPVDFFPASEYAAIHAANLAKESGARLRLLHVVSPVIPTAYEYPLNMADVIAGLEESSARELKKLVKKLKLPASSVETEIRTGQIVATIKSAITEFKPDLVTMGTHGHKSLGRWFLGSTTERLLRQSPAPLLTMSGKVRTGPAGFRRILVTTDFSEGTVDALSYAFSLAQENQARVTLLHIMQNAGVAQERPVVRDLQAQLEKMVPKDAKDWCTVETRIDTGAPYRRILDIAKKQKVDLIVMNIHGKGMFERALLGSNAERVVRAATCPVMLIPPLRKAAKARSNRRAAA